MKPGDILCLENTRFHKGEENNDPAFVEALAQGSATSGSTTRSRPRTVPTPRPKVSATSFPAYAGRTMQAELDALAKALEAPQRPVAAIVGGAKVSTKLDLLGNLVAKVDVLMIGGGMANTFLLALGKNVGKSLAEKDLAGTAREILAKAKAKGCEIVLPVDATVAQKFEARRAVARRRRGCRSAADDMILDIGPRSDRARRLGAGARQDAGLERAVRARSRWNPSTPARSRSPKPPPS